MILLTIDSSDMTTSRRKRIPARSSTIDSTNSNSDGADDHNSDDASVHSYSNYSRSRHNSKKTSKLVKSESSNSLNVPSRNKSVSSGSSVRSLELKKSGLKIFNNAFTITFMYFLI